MGALAIVVWRFAIYSLFAGATRAARGQGLSLYAFRKSLVGGIVLAIDVGLFFTALKHTSIVNATIIGSLQPLLLTAYGVRFLGERVSRRDAVLGLIALAGALTIVISGTESGQASGWGDLAAVGALIAWSTYFVIAKQVASEVEPADFTISASIVVAVGNAPIAVLAGQSLAWPGINNVLWISAMAVTAGILGHQLMNWALPRIPLWLGSTFTLFVPVVSSALAWVWLDEPLNARQIIAMAVTFAALALLVWFQQGADAASHDRSEVEQAPDSPPHRVAGEATPSRAPSAGGPEVA